MAELLMTVVAGAGLYWFLILRPGRIDFWKVAANHPDPAYEHFRADPTWVVLEEPLPRNYRDQFPASEWSGPFTLMVPKLGGKMIRVFGREASMDQSQDEFLRKVVSGSSTPEP